MVEHEHQWRQTAHYDGCHFYGTTFDCDCGATHKQEQERNPLTDEYSAVWMTDDDGRPMCPRCAEILRGGRN